MELKIDFYADTFRSGTIKVPDNWKDLPACDCTMRHMADRHHCKRGKFTEFSICDILERMGIDIYPMIIRCKVI